MNYRSVTTTDDKKEFLRFGRKVYEGNPCYRDSTTDIVKMFLYRKTAYLGHAEVFPFMIEESGENLLRAAYILGHKLKDILMVSFFEARRNAEGAVDLMLSRGKELAAGRGMKKMIIGLNARLNYGVAGFLASHHDVAPTFGFTYNPGYYLDYFQGFREICFTSFLAAIESFNPGREEKAIRRAQRKGYSFRLANLQKLAREVRIYTSLNNHCFGEHLWWAERTFEEDWEMFSPFRWFMRGENLILAERYGEPVGFLLWYPNFNQLIPPGGGLGVPALLKYRLGGGQISRIKIAEIGMKPGCQGTGAVMGLFDLLYRCVRGRFQTCEAG